ncbi:MAG: MBL fold metallo-hydrolase [Bdellovibrio sp.]|nr:MBL fold metallo-hydrolase [Bdellovibrio sp.]
MELTWLGTAGFIVKSKEGEIAFDPFLSRGQGEASPFTPKSFENTQAIFVGHGHFDHTFDIPEIANNTEAKIYAPGLTGQLLKMRGVSGNRVHHAGNKETLFKDFKMRAFKSSHVNFDMPLILSTIKRCGVRGCMHICGLGVSYPQGMVQSYYFEAGGKKILFLSSATNDIGELKQYRDLEVDYYLAPLQGHTNIQDLAAKHVSIIKPKVVIPHHHDNFYPPLSQDISAEVFKEKLTRSGFKGDFLEIPLFKNIQL